MENISLFREENHNDGKGKYQSYECYIKGEFTAVQVNCNIDISIYGANEQEILDNKLVTVDKLLTDLYNYRKQITDEEFILTNREVKTLKYTDEIKDE